MVKYSIPGTDPQQPTRNYLVYFLTGNPGIIDYYTDFLFRLFGKLSKNRPNHDANYHIIGDSLDGFAIDPPDGRYFVDRNRKHPLGLDEQIHASLDKLAGHVREIRSQTQDSDVRVILIGHSVGTYILLEILRILREQKRSEEPFRVIGGICLFATVTHIAKSASGKKLTAFTQIPLLPFLVHIFARCLTLFIPIFILQRIVSIVTGFPPNAAKTTAQFLKSKFGVWQALHMGRDEMSAISIDKWDSDIWGAATPPKSGNPRAKLYLYFGANDHWVANETRDQLIASRAYAGDNDTWKPKMEIDRNGIPHSFSIQHSEPISELTAEYIREIVQADQ